MPSGLITENELAAAKTVKMPFVNPQDQQRIVWAPSFVLARAYLDQLVRIERTNVGDDRGGADHAGQRRAALGSRTEDGADRSSPSQLKARRRRVEGRIQSHHARAATVTFSICPSWNAEHDGPGVRDGSMDRRLFIEGASVLLAAASLERETSKRRRFRRLRSRRFARTS